MKFILLLSAAMLLVLSACGGGGGDDAPSSNNDNVVTPIPDEAVGGIWDGTDNSGDRIQAVVTESGQMHYIAYAGALGYGTVTASGSAIDMDFIMVALEGFSLPDGSKSANCTAIGTIQERQSLDLTADCTTEFDLDFTSTAALTYNNLYDRDSSLAAIAGHYQGLGAVVDIASNGAIFAQDTYGCVITGQVNIIDSRYNAYEFAIEYSGCPGEYATFNGGTYGGIAILDDTGISETLTIAMTGTFPSLPGVVYSLIETLPRL